MEIQSPKNPKSEVQIFHRSKVQIQAPKFHKPQKKQHAAMSGRPGWTFSTRTSRFPEKHRPKMSATISGMVIQGNHGESKMRKPAAHTLFKKHVRTQHTHTHTHQGSKHMVAGCLRLFVLLLRFFLCILHSKVCPARQVWVC